MFNSSIDVYNGVLHELNHENSAFFEMDNYEYAVNKACIDLTTLRYTEFETKELRTASLEHVTTVDRRIDVTSNVAALPTDCMFLLSVRTIDQRDNECEGVPRYRTIYKTTADRKTFDNYYDEVEHRYQVTKGNLLITPAPKLTVGAVYIDYIQAPFTSVETMQRIDLDQPHDAPINRLIPLLRKPLVASQIVTLTASYFLEITESPRTQSHIGLNGLLPLSH
jgi:hypothetical protein